MHFSSTTINLLLPGATLLAPAANVNAVRPGVRGLCQDTADSADVAVASRLLHKAEPKEINMQQRNESTSVWDCYLGTSYEGTVEIWWGHSVGDARWACSAWISQCGNSGGCDAYYAEAPETTTAVPETTTAASEATTKAPFVTTEAPETTTNTTDSADGAVASHLIHKAGSKEISTQHGKAADTAVSADGAVASHLIHKAEPKSFSLTSVWDCYSYWGLVYEGTVEIWWGHLAGDAEWACNEWISDCGNSGGCVAYYT